jgi:hypothetical protein
MQRVPEIKKVVTKSKLSDKKTDAAYWRKQPYSARLAALEEIRQEYHRWRYGGEARMQKVVNIIRLKKKATGRHQNVAELENLE